MGDFEAARQDREARELAWDLTWMVIFARSSWPRYLSGLTQLPRTKT